MIKMVGIRKSLGKYTEKTEEQNEDVKGNQNKNQDVSDNDEEIEEDGEGKSTEDTTENLDNEMEIPEEWNE
jgi:phage shock protein A